MLQSIIVAIVVVAAVVWAIWTIVKRAGSGGCASCGDSGSCPYAKTDQAPPEQINRADAGRESHDGK